MPVLLGSFISEEVYDKKLRSVHKIEDMGCVAFVDVNKGREERCGNSWRVCIHLPMCRIEINPLIAIDHRTRMRSIVLSSSYNIIIGT